MAGVPLPRFAAIRRRHRREFQCRILPCRLIVFVTITTTERARQPSPPGAAAPDAAFSALCAAIGSENASHHTGVAGTVRD